MSLLSRLFISYLIGLRATIIQPGGHFGKFQELCKKDTPLADSLAGKTIARPPTLGAPGRGGPITARRAHTDQRHLALAKGRSASCVSTVLSKTRPRARGSEFCVSERTGDAGCSEGSTIRLGYRQEQAICQPHVWHAVPVVRHRQRCDQCQLSACHTTLFLHWRR